MLALQNFLLVVVFPIASMTFIIWFFRWWMKRRTGYDPIGSKEHIHPTEREISTRSETYAPYLPPKWREEKAAESEQGRVESEEGGVSRKTL